MAGRKTGSYAPQKGSPGWEHSNYLKENSLHRRLEEEGFVNISFVKKTDTKGLSAAFNSCRGCRKIVVSDGAEIGAEPVYLPKPLKSYYVVYVKDTRQLSRRNSSR